jgi:hypothetical protein
LSEEKLTNFLQSGKDWSKLRTSVQGIFVLKLPAYRNSPTRLAVELNPIGESGNPKKRRGLVLRSLSEFEEFKDLLLHDKLPKLVKLVDSINPATQATRKKKGEDVLEL